MIGPLLAPSYFVFSIPCEESGRATKESIESALRAFENHLVQKGTPSPFSVTADEAIEVLLYLELCIPVKNMPGVYHIPALLKDTIPADAWGEDPSMNVHRGQRCQCVHSVDIISPSSFVILQCRCYHMPNVRHKAWKDGLKLVKIVDDKVIECLIEMGIKKSHHCIDVVLRWSSEVECGAVAKDFLDQLKLMIGAVCDERSLGVILNWFYIDSSHLQQRDDDPAIYSTSEVDQKVKDKTFDHILFSARPEGDCRSRIRDLVIIAAHTSGISSDNLKSLYIRSFSFRLFSR